MTIAPITITGVIQPSTGGAQRQDGRWVLVFELGPWKRVGAAQLAKRPIRVEVPVATDKLDREMTRLAEGLAVRLTLTKLTEARQWDNGVGVAPVRIVVPSADLKAAVEALRPKVTVKDAVLGRLDLDRKERTLEGRVRLAGHACTLSVTQSGTSDDRARDLRDVARARTVVAAVSRKVGAILKAVVREYVPIYNPGWRTEGPALTATAFATRLTPRSLVIHDDGSSTLWIDSEKLFEDHVVEVHLDVKGAIEETGLA